MRDEADESFINQDKKKPLRFEHVAVIGLGGGISPHMAHWD